MSLEKRIGFGFTLDVDPAGGTTYTTLGNIVDGFTGPDAKADSADVSILSDTFKDFRKAQVDPGNFTFTIAYDPLDTTSQTLASMLASTAVAQWKVTYPGTSANETFKGFLESMGREVKKANLVTCSITVKVCGDPGFKTS